MAASRSLQPGRSALGLSHSSPNPPFVLTVLVEPLALRPALASLLSRSCLSSIFCSRSTASRLSRSALQHVRRTHHLPFRSLRASRYSLASVHRRTPCGEYVPRLVVILGGHRPSPATHVDSRHGVDVVCAVCAAQTRRVRPPSARCHDTTRRGLAGRAQVPVPQDRDDEQTRPPPHTR